jgi:hypothetical protein
MSALGPLQKFTRTLAASGAFTRNSTLPALSTRGYSAPQTLVVAGWKVLASCAQHIVVKSNIMIPAIFILFVLIFMQVWKSFGLAGLHLFPRNNWLRAID